MGGQLDIVGVEDAFEPTSAPEHPHGKAPEDAEFDGTVRAPETLVDLALHNANRHDTIHGPVITVPPLQAKLADVHPSCREAVLDAIDRLHQRTGATAFARRDIVAEVQATRHGFERQTIYRCLRRMTGQEGGSAHRDLEDSAMANCDFAGDELAERLRLDAAGLYR